MIRRLGLLGSLLILAACASAPERPPAADPERAWRARQETLSPMMTWKIQGRVAVKTANEGWQASLHWTRAVERHDIDLAGPLGSGRVRLSQDRLGAQLRDADQHTYHADSAQQLLYRVTGWDLPLEGLNYWVLGLPVPGVPWHKHLDAWGRLERLEQMGWNIRFLEYLQEGEYEVPAKLFMKREVGENDMAAETDRLPPQSTLELRLVIQRWLKLE